MDRDAKRAQIESIEDEVNVLHPLLHDLFKRVDGVTYVENTHGPNEMGADFVIERTDKAIRDTYYIGVIVKAEKILQNFSDVERQIDECKVPRLIRQGKQEVILQEIWVVTSRSISQNAKIKIREEYPQRRIVFFDSEWIVDLVEEHFPFYWHQLPTATGTYLASLLRNIAELNAQTTLLQIPNASDKYIDLESVSKICSGTLQEAPAYETAAEFEERFVNTGQPFVANSKSTKPMQPSNRAFHHPASLAQTAAVLGPAPRDLGLDT